MVIPASTTQSNTNFTSGGALGSLVESQRPRRALLFPNDSVTKALFYRGPSYISASDYARRRNVMVKVADDSHAEVSVVARNPEMFAGDAGALSFGDLAVMAAIAALAEDGADRFGASDVLRSFGFSNPASAGMAKTRARVESSIERLAGMAIRVGDVASSRKGGGIWLPGFPDCAIVRCAEIEPGLWKLKPANEGSLLSAIPLVERAKRCGQVIPLEDGVIPADGSRFGYEHRLAAAYVAIRARQKLPNRKILLSTMLRDLEVSFDSTDAGRKRKSRWVAQLTRLLDAMSAADVAIRGFAVERSGRALRAVLVSPACDGDASHAANNPSPEDNYPSQGRNYPSHGRRPDITVMPGGMLEMRPAGRNCKSFRTFKSSIGQTAPAEPGGPVPRIIAIKENRS